MLAMVVFSGIKHWHSSQVFFAVYLGQPSQIANLSAATERGATVGSSSSRFAVSLIEAANDRRQHSGLSLMANPSNSAKHEGATVLSRFLVCGKLTGVYRVPCSVLVRQ